VTNEWTVTTGQVVESVERVPYRDWAIHFSNSSFGLMEWGDPECDICFFNCTVTVPFGAPVVLAALVLIALILLITASYLARLLTPKDAPTDAKLD